MNISEYLSYLALEDNYAKIKKPNIKYQTSDQKDYDCMLKMSESLETTSINMLTNFNRNEGKYLYPSGYYATIPIKEKFNIDVLDENLFRGISFYKLKKRKNKLKEEDSMKLLYKLNLLLRDVSQLPFKKKDNFWLPSLTPFSWGGMYEERREEEDQYWIIFVSGLDHKVYIELYDHALKNWHGKITYEDFLKEIKEYRDYTQENRRRIIGLFLFLLKEDLGELEYIPLNEDVIRKESDPDLTPDKNWWDRDIMGFDLPPWFIFPSKPIKFPLKDIPPENTGYHLGTYSIENMGFPRIKKVDHDLCLNDILSEVSSGSVHKLSMCTKSATDIPYVRGPLDPITIFNSITKKQVIYPSQARPLHQCLESVEQFNTVWESPEITVNLNSSWTYQKPRMEEMKTSKTFKPLFVRISGMNYERKEFLETNPGRFHFFTHPTPS